MLTGLSLLLVFLASIAILLVVVIKFKLNPFLALLLVSYLTGFAVRMPFSEINKNVAEGFGSTMGGIGIVIGLGIVLGIILSKSGAMEKIAKVMLKWTGQKHATLAISLTGLIVSITVFMDAAFVILFPLVLSISKITKIPKVTLTTALAVGLIISHSMIVPTPGPVEAVNNLVPNYGLYIGLALAISTAATLTGAWLYGIYIGKKKGMDGVVNETDQLDSRLHENSPGTVLSFACLLMPITLILLGSSISFFVPDSLVTRFLSFFGDRNVALFVSVLFSMLVLRKYLAGSVNELISESGEAAGMIMLITGAGGAYGFIVNQSGIGNYIVETMTGLNFSILVTGFVLSALLRASLGSATVALIAASTIIGPSFTGTEVSRTLVTIAICLGGIGFSLPNDSGFWVVSRFAKLSVKQTLASWSVGGTIAALTGFALLYIISLFI